MSWTMPLVCHPIEQPLQPSQVFQCPQSYASQPKPFQQPPPSSSQGEQQQSSKTTTTRSTRSTTTQSSSKKTRTISKKSASCQESQPPNETVDYSILGIIYKPEETSKQQEGYSTNRQQNDGTLYITINKVDDPSDGTIVAGARIPMSQIQSFPISFSLFKDNLLVRVEDGKDGIQTNLETLWDQKVLYALKDLYVTVRVCPKATTTTLCPISDSVYQGRGYSKLLLLPSRSDPDEFQLVRSAASIRLSSTTKSDALITW